MMIKMMDRIGDYNKDIGIWGSIILDWGWELGLVIGIGEWDWVLALGIGIWDWDGGLVMGIGIEV